MDTMYVFRVFIVLVAIRNSECCVCLRDHPQSWYCSSDFVIRGQVLTEKLTTHEDDLPWVLPHFRWPTRAEYDVYVQQVYKGSDVVSAESTVTIISQGAHTCNPVYLAANHNFIIMGRSNNNGLEIPMCGYASPTHTITRRQFQGFRYTYQRTCNQCSICVNFGWNYPDFDNCDCTVDISNYWYSDTECEIDFARCGLNHAGNCVWLGYSDYRRCKGQE